MPKGQQGKRLLWKICRGRNVWGKTADGEVSIEMSGCQRITVNLRLGCYKCLIILRSCCEVVIAWWFIAFALNWLPIFFPYYLFLWSYFLHFPMLRTLVRTGKGMMKQLALCNDQTYVCIAVNHLSDHISDFKSLKGLVEKEIAVSEHGSLFLCKGTEILYICLVTYVFGLR